MTVAVLEAMPADTVLLGEYLGIPSTAMKDEDGRWGITGLPDAFTSENLQEDFEIHREIYRP